jgi:hypothetical protein
MSNQNETPDQALEQTQESLLDQINTGHPDSISFFNAKLEELKDQLIVATNELLALTPNTSNSQRTAANSRCEKCENSDSRFDPNHFSS